jgi:hypothetical protein
MTQPNPINYEQAADLVASGQWRVDAAIGLVYGKRGLAFHRHNSWGYVQIKFRDPSDWRTEHAALAHRVIWESVHGPLDAGLTINHMNGDKTDNRLANMEAISQGANIRHALDTGLMVPTRGEDNGHSRLTDDDVRDIYRRAWLGEDQASVGMDYGVGNSIVSNIKRGWAWTHITGHVPLAQTAA